MKTAISEIMQKYNCETLVELEEKRLEFCRNIKTLEGMIDANWQRDFEYAQKLGIEMNKIAAQVREIEEAGQADA